MKKSDLKKIEEGSYIYDGIFGYEVTKVYKSGVQYYHKCETNYGKFKFGKFYFVSYEELLEDYWELVE